LSGLKSSFVKLNPIRGWLFDVYPLGKNEITVWLIAENGERVRLVDTFTHRFCVSGSFSELNSLAEKIRENPSVESWRFVKKHADFMEAAWKKVLEIDVSDYQEASPLARKIVRSGRYEKFRLYNVDVPIAQAYLYDKEVFPLAHVMVVASGKRLYCDVLDSVESVDYHTPPLRSMRLNVALKKEGVLQKLTDKIDSMSLDFGDKP
jgi:DNA polymerase elongation subunit (family B)